MGRGYSSLKWTSDFDWCNFLGQLSVLMKFSHIFPKKKKKKKEAGCADPIKVSEELSKFFSVREGSKVVCVSVYLFYFIFLFKKKVPQYSVLLMSSSCAYLISLLLFGWFASFSSNLISKFLSIWGTLYVCACLCFIFYYFFKGKGPRFEIMHYWTQVVLARFSKK